MKSEIGHKDKICFTVVFKIIRVKFPVTKIFLDYY